MTGEVVVVTRAKVVRFYHIKQEKCDGTEQVYVYNSSLWTFHLRREERFYFHLPSAHLCSPRRRWRLLPRGAVRRRVLVR